MSKSGESLPTVASNVIPLGIDDPLAAPIKLTRGETRHIRRIKTVAAHAAEHGIEIDKLAELQHFFDRHPVPILMLLALDEIKKSRQSNAQRHALNDRIERLERDE